jgi:hypothetical protein
MRREDGQYGSFNESKDHLRIPMSGKTSLTESVILTDLYRSCPAVSLGSSKEKVGSIVIVSENPLPKFRCASTHQISNLTVV